MSHQWHHCTHIRVCHSTTRSVGGLESGLMIPGKTNSKPNTARRARHNRPTSALEPDSWLQLRGATGRSTPLNRDGVVTAASQRHRPADPAWACQLVKEALDKAKIQAWFTQRDTTKHVLTHPSLDRKVTISQTTFQMNSRELRVSYFDLIFTDVYS